MDGLTLVFRLSGANSKHRGCLDHKQPGMPAASQAAGHGTYGTGRMEQRTLLHGLGYLTYLLAITVTLVFAVQDARAQENHATAPDTLKEWLYSYAPTQYFRLPNFDIERGGRNAIGLWTEGIGTRTWYMRSKADTLNSFSWPFPAFQYYPADVNGDGRGGLCLKCRPGCYAAGSKQSTIAKRDCQLESSSLSRQLPSL